MAEDGNCKWRVRYWTEGVKSVKKYMKFALTALCLTAVITLCGCFSDPVYRYKESVDGVISVQILRVGENEEILADNVDAGILSELQGLKLRRYLNDPVTIIAGLVIRVNYESGCYELISAQCFAYYNGKKLRYEHGYFDRDEFEVLVTKYIAPASV